PRRRGSPAASDAASGSATLPERDENAVEPVLTDQGEAAQQHHALVREQPRGVAPRRAQAEHPDPLAAEHQRERGSERLVAALEVPGPQGGCGLPAAARVPEVAPVARPAPAGEL